MESRLAPREAAVPAPFKNHLRTQGNSISRYERDRAHAFAESISRTASSLEDTIRVADQCLIAGLAAVARGELPYGANQLTKSLIATALTAWQSIQLSFECIELGRHADAVSRRAASELQMRLLVDHARLATSALRSVANGDTLVTEVRGTLSAFVVGCGVSRSVLNGSRLAEWRRSLTNAFDGTSDGSSEWQVKGLGLPKPGVPVLAERDALVPAQMKPRPRLSERERDVLNQIVGGYTTAQVAHRLGVKTTTVATLVGRIFNKLGVNNRAAAVGIALSYGLCAAYDDGPALNT